MLKIVASTFAQQAKIDSLNRVWVNVKDDTSRVNTLNGICRGYTFRSDYALAHEYANKALDLAQKIEWQKGIAQSYINIGIIYEDESYYPDGLNAGMKALTIGEALNNKLLIAESLDIIGMNYYEERHQTKAFGYYSKALKLNEGIGNISGMAKNFQNLGNLKEDSIKTGISRLEYYLKALELYQELNDSDGIARTLWDIAFIYRDKYDFPTAFEYDFKALRIFQKLEDKKGLGSNLWLTGDLYYYTVIQVLHGEIESKQLPDSLRNKKVMLRKAVYYLNRAVTIDSAIGSLLDLKSDYADLGDAYSHLGNYKMAFLVKGQQLRIEGLIFSDNNRIKIAELTARREAEIRQKEMEIQNLKLEAAGKQRWFLIIGLVLLLLSSLFIFLFYKRRRDAQQKQKEAEFNRSVSDVEMKALRAQMNPHFIFNSLQSIQNFLHQKNPDEANIYLLKFSKLMRMVLENSQYAEVPLEEDLQSLGLYMQLESLRLKHPFTYEIKVDESIDQQETKIPPLILQPFVENAIWHGLQYKDKPGEIKIIIRKNNDTLICTVEDNGVGIDRSKPLNGSAPLKKFSLGMKLTEERLKILSELKKVKAHFNIIGILNSENNPCGTRIELSLPC